MFIYLLLILGDQRMSVEGGGDKIVKWINPIRRIDSPHVIVQRVFEHALFSRLRVQMHKDLKIGQRPWNWQQYAS